jgi:hypothetical protein
MPRSANDWPGRSNPDDDAVSGIASLTSRPPRLVRDMGRPVPQREPEPIDADWQEIPTADGGVIVRMGGPELLDSEPETAPYDEDFYANLAEDMSESDLAEIAEDLLEGIEADIQSRAVWMANYEQGMAILGIQQKKPRSEASGEGVSVVDHPLLLEAAIAFQSNTCAELLPAAGPVKIDNGGQETAITDEDATQLEKDMNQYLTVHRPEYYPDTERMIFQQGFGGMGFKKIFHCPLRRAPVSDTIQPGDFIISNDATSLENCTRKTHRIKMRPSIMKRMQYVGAYRKVDLQTPVDDQTGIERKTSEIQGIRPQAHRYQDTEHTVFECCAELDLAADQHKENGKPTGLPRPYIVTIEKDSRVVLEVRRNWVDGDDLFTERRRFSAYPFIPMFGFYASGLLNVLGNTTSALTAGWRIMLDAGMFANFPGGMYAKTGDRQMDNNFRAAPGEWVGVDLGGSDDIRKTMMAFPYKEPGPASQAFIQHIAETGQRVGGTANIPVAEGKADAPVGTMLAALEQVSKMLSAVHRRSHQAQSVEFQVLLELIREKPEDFVKFFEKDGFWTVERLRRAMDNWSLIPRADPNTPTQMHRIIKMMALKQLEQLAPDRYNGKAIDERILRVLGIDDPQELFAPPAAPGALPPDPTLAVAGIVRDTKMAEIAARERTEAGKTQLKLVEIKSKEQIEAEKRAIDEAKIQAQLALGSDKEEQTNLRTVFEAEQTATREAEARDSAERQAAESRASAEKVAADRNKTTIDSVKLRPKPTPGGGKPGGKK